MTRRRLVVLSSAFTLLGLGIIAGLAIVAVLKTQFGRNKARDYIARFLAPRVKGTLVIGRISGLSIGGATIDSVEIRGLDDSLLVSIPQLRVEWDARDLVDKRTLLKIVEIDRPFIHLRRDSAGVWNYKRIFPPGPPKKRVAGAERGWGDYIVADSVAIRRGTFVLTMPWHPDDSLHGARRDSAVAYNLARKDKEIRRSGGNFERTYRWNRLDLDLGYARLADPDSVGRLFQLARLDVDEVDPPFKFRNVRGGVRQTGDSLWLDLAHFDLPASTGKATGKVMWGGPLPTRYDLRIVGDSVSLADVGWVYPTLPETGGGSMVLNIRNEPQNLSILDYALSDMDVRTTRSRLRGKMTFGVGGPVLIVKDLALEADPINFDLLRTLAGGPFPYDWQGNISGTIRGRGGPLNRFRVDDARVTFADANVPGAVTRATANGELDILFPAFTRFRGFNVNVGQLDLRTIEHLNPNFPRVGGIVSGTATLDSMWLDVRFRNADLTHRDGPADPTRATGSGRVTLGDDFTSYDLALNVQPISFTTLARSYPSLPLRGSYHGPMRIEGTLDDLALTTDLTGPAGRFAYDGRIDGYPTTYGAHGTLQLADLDVRTLLANDTIPVTSLNGRIELDVTADSASLDSTLTSLSGVVSANIERSFVDSMRVYVATARLGFNQGRMRLDTLRLETVAGVVAARGAIGLTGAVTDTLAFAVDIDSLGGLRRYVARPVAAGATTTDTAAAPPDSLDGELHIAGKVFGSIDSLGVLGDISGRDLWLRGDRAKAIAGGFEFRDLTGNVAGRASVWADTAMISNVGVTRATVAIVAHDRQRGEFRVEAVSRNGPSLVVQGGGQFAGDTTFVRLDTVTLAVRDHRLRLEHSSLITLRPEGVTVDSVRVRDPEAGVVTIVGSVPVNAPIALSVRADSVDLGDVGEIIQSNAPFDGLASFRVDVSGVRTDPKIAMTGSLDDPRFGDVRLDHATLQGDYASRRLDAKANLFREGRAVLSLDASVPVDLAFTSVPNRILPDSLSGSIRSDSADLAFLETLSPLVLNASGSFVTSLTIGGVWPRPTFTGNLTVSGGALGLAPLGDVRLSDLNVDLAFRGDSIQIERMTVQTREERVGSMSLRGYVNLADWDNPRFDLGLTARDFHIIDKPRVAHLDVSASNLRLAGSYDGSILTGLVTVERGTVVIPDLIDKQLFALDTPELYSIIDTTLTMNRTLLPSPPPGLVRNLTVQDVQVRMGSDVWLRSAEANINLGGAVGVRLGRSSSAERPFDQLALEGTLTTNRGTYRLNLGIVQRTFTVENGTVQFLGDPDFNPLLNINALHTVHRTSSGNVAEQDIRIRVHIGGTLAQPQLALTSADSLLNISQTDLFSYLITGAPSFTVSSQGATASLLRTVGSFVGDWLRGGLGFVDVVDIELGRQNLVSNRGISEGLNSVFSGARLGLGRQIGDRTYVYATAGLCQVRSLLGGGGTGGSNPNLSDAFGVKVDYRLDENLGVSGSFEPPTSALLCNAGIGATRGFAPTPHQVGFDIFRTWRF